MGFADHGLTTVMGLEGKVPAGRGSGYQSVDVTDLDELAAFDAERFGAPRRVLLATLLAQNPGRALARRVDGCVAGYSWLNSAALVRSWPTTQTRSPNW